MVKQIKSIDSFRKKLESIKQECKTYIGKKLRGNLPLSFYIYIDKLLCNL